MCQCSVILGTNETWRFHRTMVAATGLKDKHKLLGFPEHKLSQDMTILEQVIGRVRAIFGGVCFTPGHKTKEFCK